MSLAPDVLAAKTRTARAPRSSASSCGFTDPELLNKAASKLNKLGNLAACSRCPTGIETGARAHAQDAGRGWKMSLSQKKHALFGPMSSPWQ
jgi:hypothetical protein